MLANSVTVSFKCLAAVVSQLEFQEALVKRVLSNQAMVAIGVSWCLLIGCARFVVALILQGEHLASRFMSSCDAL